MSSVMLSATCSFFDIKNIEESRFPSKTGAVRFLAISALVASVFASTLIPAVISTGVIAATTAAIMLKNRKIEQFNENEVVNRFKNDVNHYTEEKKYGLLTVCFSCLTEKTEEMPGKINRFKEFLTFSWNSPRDTKSYLLENIQKYAKTSGDELKQKTSEGKMVIELTKDQREIKELSVTSTLSIIEYLYIQLDKQHKAQEIANFIKQIQPYAENSIDQAEK
ncbi:MAG: hypothetical protein C5B45_06570 [Chlamydiae bacterium]|nr:MAG: hypothetical protein C5B45_06570 [Chlamydiota bacterium]